MGNEKKKGEKSADGQWQQGMDERMGKIEETLANLNAHIQKMASKDDVTREISDIGARVEQLIGNLQSEMQSWREASSTRFAAIETRVADLEKAPDPCQLMILQERVNKANRENELSDPAALANTTVGRELGGSDALNKALSEYDTDFIDNLIRALWPSAKSAFTHTRIEKYLWTDKKDEKARKVEKYKIVIYSPTAEAANHLRKTFYEWQKVWLATLDKNEKPITPRLKTPAVGKASRVGRMKLEMAAMRLKSPKNGKSMLKSFRTSLYVCKQSGSIRTTISLRTEKSAWNDLANNYCASLFASAQGMHDRKDDEIYQILKDTIEGLYDGQNKSQKRDRGSPSGHTPAAKVGRKQAAEISAPTAKTQLFSQVVARPTIPEANTDADASQPMDSENWSG